ncbi:hypothetical protein [Ignavibacterium album]|uniref:hypothetical protein n=1 Tax=Ignavibacterium album TaxID=591197 RepID=UPI0038B281DA
MPNWYPLTRYVIIVKYVLLTAILIIIDWKFAIGLFVVGFILSTIIPIPYRILYKKTFRKKVEKIKSFYPQEGQMFTEMLDKTGF